MSHSMEPLTGKVRSMLSKCRQYLVATQLAAHSHGVYSRVAEQLHAVIVIE